MKRRLSLFLVVPALHVCAASEALADPKLTYNANLAFTPASEVLVSPYLVTPLCDDFRSRYPGTSPGAGCSDLFDPDGSDLDSIISHYGVRRGGGASGGPTGPTNEFHRGIDLANSVMQSDDDDCDVAGTSKLERCTPAVMPGHSRPVFAVRGGKITKLVYTTDDDDPTKADGFRIVVEHKNGNADDNGRPFLTVYKHLFAVKGQTNSVNGSAAVSSCGATGALPDLAVGSVVQTGQFLGCTGYSSGGIHHLHFEARAAEINANGSYSLRDYNRYAVNPLRLFSSSVHSPDNVLYSEDPAEGTVTVTIQPAGLEHNGAPLLIDPAQIDGNGATLAQAEVVTSAGYHLWPDYVDLERLNYEYTHESISEGASCPFASEHGGSNHADLHFRDGDFNGIFSEEHAAVNDGGNDVQYERRFTIENFVNFGVCFDLGVTFPGGEPVETSDCQ